MSQPQSAKQSARLSRLHDKAEDARRRREEWERQQAQDLRERDAFRRRLLDAYKIWTICEHKICRRNKGCRGDTDECATRWCRVVPDEERIYLGKVLQFMAKEGMTLAQAVAATDADFKLRAEINARYAASTRKTDGDT